MILFTIYDLFTMNEYDGDGRKNTKNETNEKIFHVWLPFHPPVYEIEANCFPVSENKPDLP